MTVTTKATIVVHTDELIAGLKAVYPHRMKVKTGDHASQNRVRLIFGAGWLYIAACNTATTALARVELVNDDRGALGMLDPDDAPMVFDLQPRRVPLILAQFKVKSRAKDVRQMSAFDLEIEDEDRTLDLTDVGGLWSEGESIRFPCEHPAEAFPDVLSLSGIAASNAGSNPAPKYLVQDGRVLALFKATTDAYSSDLDIRSTGGPESGFVVLCGNRFVGTVANHQDGDDGMKRRDQNLQEWLGLLPTRKLKSA